MPQRARRPCAEPGCPALASSGRWCDEHRPSVNERRLRHDDRQSSTARGYDARWRKVRNMVMQREPLCRTCKANGRTTPAVEVDHIVALRDGGERLAFSNLQPLCKRCHARKTADEVAKRSARASARG